MSEYVGDGTILSLDEKLERKKAGAYDQWAAVTDPEYASTVINEDGRFLNEPYLTPGDASKRLGCERNKFRKLATETFRDCLVDITERNNEDPDESLGRQNRAKTLLSTRDLEIMKIVLYYKERGVSDSDIKEEIVNRKNGVIKIRKDTEGNDQLPADPAFQQLIRDVMFQTAAASGEVFSRQLDTKLDTKLDKKIDPVQKTVESIQNRIDAAFSESVETAMENERLKLNLEAKESELENLKKDAEEKIARIEKDAEEKIARLEAELNEAKAKKRPWFKFW